LSPFPFKEEVRGSNPLRATDRVVVGLYAIRFPYRPLQHPLAFVAVEIVFHAELPKTLIGEVLRRQVAAEEPGVPVVLLPRAG